MNTFISSFDQYAKPLFMSLLLLIANNTQSKLPAQDAIVVDSDLLKKNLATPNLLMTNIDKLDEQAVLEILKRENIENDFKKIPARTLSNEAFGSYRTMMGHSEFRKNGFDIYKFGDKIFFLDRNPNGDLYLVDRFMKGKFEFAKLHRASQSSLIQELLRRFDFAKKLETNQVLNLDTKIKDSIEIVGTNVSQNDYLKVLATFKECPPKIMNDLLDPDWGLQIKLLDVNQVKRNPALLLPYLGQNSDIRTADRIAKNAGAFYNTVNDTVVAGQLIIFTGKTARFKQDILHELGHILDQRLKYHLLKNSNLELNKEFGFEDKISFGFSDASKSFNIAHKSDISYLINNLSSLTSGNSFLFARAKYYDDANLQTSLNSQSINNAGNIETFAENIATLIDRDGDYLAKFFKRAFPDTLLISKKVTESVYGKGIFDK